MPRTLKPEKLEALRAAYKRGDTVNAAKRSAGCAYRTAHINFARFKHEGIERGEVKRAKCGPKTEPVRKYPPTWALPVYMGPTMIGKAIDSESRI